MFEKGSWNRHNIRTPVCFQFVSNVFWETNYSYVLRMHCILIHHIYSMFDVRVNRYMFDENA